MIITPLTYFFSYSLSGNNFLSVSKSGENEQKVITIIGIFNQIPAASAKFIEPLCKLVLQTEKSVMVGTTILSCIKA
jgi:hypothetical protein